MSLAEPKTSPGIVVTERLNELAEHARVSSLAATGVGPALWYRPEPLTKTLLDPNNYHEAFDRQQHENEFDKAVTDQESFGTTTDLALSQLQGDLLHCAERAFRARHHTSVRNRIHPAGRLAGQALPLGVIQNGMLGYIIGLDRLNKSESDSPNPNDLA